MEMPPIVVKVKHDTDLMPSLEQKVEDANALVVSAAAIFVDLENQRRQVDDGSNDDDISDDDELDHHDGENSETQPMRAIFTHGEEDENDDDDNRHECQQRTISRLIVWILDHFRVYEQRPDDITVATVESFYESDEWNDDCDDNEKEEMAMARRRNASTLPPPPRRYKWRWNRIIRVLSLFVALETIFCAFLLILFMMQNHNISLW